MWAVSNSTAAATFEQFVTLVQKGILKALSSVLKMKEARILAVALEGIENILKSGSEHFPMVIFPHYFSNFIFSIIKKINLQWNWKYVVDWKK